MNPFPRLLMAAFLGSTMGSCQAASDQEPLAVIDAHTHTRIPGYLNALQRAIPRRYWKQVFHDNAVRVFTFKS